MKRISFLILFLSLLPIVSVAQTKQQQAIVKTHGRLQDDGSVKAGRPIPDALVEIKGGAKIFSDEQGELAFGVSASNEYSFTNISKEGYTLSDWDIIAHTLQYSETPKDILLEDLEEQKAYRRTIERKVRRNYNVKLEALQNRIDSLRQLADANAEEIEKLQADIDASYDMAEQYIDDMTNRYLSIDFDRADDFDRKLSAYILNGELDRADSMLATKGDIVERVRQNKLLQNAVAQDLEEVGRDCFRKFEIAYQRMQRDSAAYYLELRAELDRHNIDWQIEVAGYITSILADYNRALAIYLPALEHSLQYYGELHEKTETLYNNIGYVYDSQGNYPLALEYYNKALVIREKLFGIEHPDVAASYNNIGFVYKSQGNYPLALEYYNKALVIWEKVLGAEHPDVATSYNNIGQVNFIQGNYPLALEYHNKALAIREKVLGTDHPNVATSYNNIGSVYSSQGNYPLALEYHNKALVIFEKLFGIEHLNVATSYNNIGGVYDSQGNYPLALEYYNKALAIRERVLDTDHPNVAASYNNFGQVYSSQGNYPLALEYFNKALVILEKLFGTDHPNVATSYNNIGCV